ncbi:MAG: LysM peptidoglycan-binding domain-containing protein [Myxococcota bacterium]
MRTVLLMMTLLGGCETIQQALNGETAPPPVEYTVVRGDTLSKIARAYDVTVPDLKAANGLRSDLIEIGQVLIIPTQDTPPAAAVADTTPRRRSGSRRSTGQPASSDGGGGGGGGAPLAGLSMPKEKACLKGPSLDDLSDDEPEMMASAGLSYAQVKGAMDVYLNRLSRCAQAEDAWPQGNAQLEIVVACSGRVRDVRVSSNQGLSDSMVGCARDLVRYTAFPAHDMPDGYAFSYPLTFSM